MAITGNFLDIMGGRLTLTTATPVTTADVVDAGTLYYTPYPNGGGNAVNLYNGSNWVLHALTERSLDISGYTASRLYDIWLYDNAGTVTMDSTIWTNGTTRATALTTQDGRYVKTGDTTRRYLGTIYMSAVEGDCDDSVAWRGVWNYYNRVERACYATDTTGHSIETVYRPFNNDTSIRFNFCLGVNEEEVYENVWGSLSAGAGIETALGINGDATNGADYWIAKDTTAEVHYQSSAGTRSYVEGAHYCQATQRGTGGAGNFYLVQIRATFNG